MTTLYKTTGLFPFYRDSQERDWQKLGYYNNWMQSLKFIPKDTLASFRTPLMTGSLVAPSNMYIRKLRILDSIITVLETTEYTSDLKANYEVINGDTFTYYYRLPVTISPILTRGCIYDIYIEDSEGNKFKSDIFCAIDVQDLYLQNELSQYILTEDGQQIVI